MGTRCWIREWRRHVETAALCAVALGVLATAGCATGADMTSAASASPSVEQPTPAVDQPAPAADQPAPSDPADGRADGIEDCRDGDCEVQVREGTQIPLDPRFEVTRFEVTSVGDDRVRVETESEGGGSTAVSGQVGSLSTVNGFAIRIVAVDGDTATLRIEEF